MISRFSLTGAINFLCLFTATLAAVVAVRQGIAVTGLLLPAGVCTGLSVAAIVYHHRGVESFVLCLRSLVVLVAFSAAFVVLQYGIASTAKPWADGFLASLDASVGLSAGDAVKWAADHPVADMILWLAYFSILPQTVFAIVHLGLTNDSERLNRFMLRFIVAALLTAGCFYYFPAKGSVASFSHAIPSHYAGIIQHLDGLRSGVLTTVSPTTAEGLITFPSFHTIWGVLLIWAYRGRIAFYPVLLLNTIMLVSTVTTGMHYFADVAGGLFVCVLIYAVELCSASSRAQFPVRQTACIGTM